MSSSQFGVDTIELDSLSSQWAQHVEHLDDWIAHARVTGSLGIDGWANPNAGSNELMSLIGEVQLLRERAHHFANSLRRAAELFEETENQINLVCQRTADVVWWLMGRFSPVFAMMFGGSALTGYATYVLFGAALKQLSPELKSAYDSSSVRLMASILSSPSFVKTVEISMGSLDEALGGALGVPLPLVLAVGSAGLGITSTAGTARLASRMNAIVAHPTEALIASTGGGRTIDTTIDRAETASARAPKDFSQALERIPTDSNGGAQVRIEQYGTEFIVYIGGTVNGSLGAGVQPWDMSSNVAALGGDPAASENAVRQAMTEAGITSEDRVILVGHSQGGLVAMRIAQSADVTTTAVITAGAPIHHIEPPVGVQVIAFEHTDDVVPALGGPIATLTPNDPKTDSMGATGILYVRREALAGEPPAGDDLLPAHNIDRYVDTARIVNDLEDSRLTSAQNTLANLARDGTSSLWRARRTG